MLPTIPDELAHLLASAGHIVALTGAGVSAESGVPTFRDAQTGLWAQYRPEELATPEAFQQNPGLVWSWYQWRRGLVRQALPNAGHHALARLASRHPSVTLITQNVDGLHQRAGSPEVIEFHGNLFVDRCSRHDCHLQQAAAETAPAPPRCPRCSGLLRPAVVWFGEAIPAEALDAAHSAIERADLLLSIGTSSLVYPAAGLAERAARHQACIVEINPQPTPLSDLADFRIVDTAARALPALVDVAFP